MKKIILSMVMLTSTIALAQVKVGTDVTNLATNANFQVEGAAPTNQFVVMNDGKVGIGTLTPSNGLLNIGNGTTNPAIWMYPPTGGGTLNFVSTFDGNVGADYGAFGFASGSKNFYVASMTKLILSVSTTSERVGINLSSLTPAATLDINGDMKLSTTPTITTATKVLVKDPATSIISEQVVTGTQVETVSIAATPYQVVTGNTLHNTASTGVILTSPNGSKWLLTVNDDGSFKSTAVTP